MFILEVLGFFSPLLEKIIKATPLPKEKQKNPNPKTPQILETGVVILTKASVFVLAKRLNLGPRS